MAAPEMREVAVESRRGRMANFCMAILALAGLIDATYLTIMHLTGDDSLCGGDGGCSKVLGSVYASFHGIPTAAFGVLAYFVAFSAAIFAGFGSSVARPILTLTIAAMLLATLCFLYLQAFVLHAFCPFCLFSAAMTFLLAAIALFNWRSR